MTTLDLDKMSREELMGFWSRVNAHPILVARELFPDRPEKYVAATASLGNYAANRAAMLACHEKGDQHGVGVYSFICMTIRASLPLWAD